MGHVRRSARKVNRVDQDLVVRSGALPATPVDSWLKSLSRSANKGRLWFVLAALFAARKGPTRRAAVRGIGAIAFASASANLVGKNLFPRRRPAAELLPLYRRLARRPTSSSFPSGHAASAAAFTTAVALEHRGLGRIVAPVAGAVAYSRVHTGVHWPTDVLAGTAIGVGAAYATLHWWPRAPEGPAHTAHSAEVAALAEGDGLLVLVNPNAGIAGEDATDVVKQRWPRATVIHPHPGADLVEQLSSELSAGPSDIRAVGVAGGDGTVAAVAAVAAEYRLPLVVVPAGTLNHFARDIGVDGIDAAASAVAAGEGVVVDLAGVHIDGESHRWFVNTASLGGYPEMVRQRERLEERGWPKWPAAAVALHRSLKSAMPIRMSVNGKTHLVWWLFIGNGTYSPKGFAPTHRPTLDSGLLDVRYLRADVPYSRLRFVLATLTRTLDTSHVYRQRDMAELDIHLLDGVERCVATDGEVGRLGSHFRFRSRPHALSIYRPTAHITGAG